MSGPRASTNICVYFVHGPHIDMASQLLVVMCLILKGITSSIDINVEKFLFSIEITIYFLQEHGFFVRALAKKRIIIIKTYFSNIPRQTRRNLNRQQTAMIQLISAMQLHFFSQLFLRFDEFVLLFHAFWIIFKMM